MNFLSQLGILAVILIILVILIKSNQTLEKIYMEEEKKDSTETPAEAEIPEIKIPELKAPKISMPKFSFGRKKKAGRNEAEKENCFSEDAADLKHWRAEEWDESRPEDVASNGSQRAGRKPGRDSVYGNADQVSRSQATVPAGTGKSAGLMIEILDERGRGLETVKVDSFPFTIGRNEENDLILDDLSVSGFHALLEEEGGWIVLKDTGSLNKLMVNGKQETQVPVNGEIEVGFGNTTLRFLKEVKRSNPTLYYAGTSLMEEWH